MILKNTSISEDDLRNLAIRRATAAKNYLTDTAHIAPERIYFIAPKLSGVDTSDKSIENMSASRVDFKLKM